MAHRFAGKLQPIVREVEIVASSGNSDVSAAAIAVVINDVINRVLDLVTRAGATGKCRAIIQADRILAEFTVRRWWCVHLHGVLL